MNKTVVVLIISALMITGAIVFYYWDHELRPAKEAQAQEAAQAVSACDVHQAARDGDLKMLEKLYTVGCSMNKRDGFDMSPLHVAANDRVATFLIAKGANIDAKDGRGFTPLKVMQMAGRQDVVDLLKSHGASQ